MALSNTIAAPYSNIPHPIKDTKTNPSRETYCIRLWCRAQLSFVYELHQPIAQQQKSCLKDKTHFINFLEKTKVRENKFLVSMDITSLYTNIPQEKRIYIVCNAYKAFHGNEPPIPTWLLQRALKLILVENSFQWRKLPTSTWNCQEHQLKMAATFVNIFMVKVETEILNKSALKQLVWRLFVDDIFSLWDTAREEITQLRLTNTIKLPSLRLKFPEQKQSSLTLNNWILKRKI